MTFLFTEMEFTFTFVLQSQTKKYPQVVLRQSSFHHSLSCIILMMDPNIDDYDFSKNYPNIEDPVRVTKADQGKRSNKCN